MTENCRWCGKPMASKLDIHAGIHVPYCYWDELQDQGVTSHPGFVDEYGWPCWRVGPGECTWSAAERGVKQEVVYQIGALDRYYCRRHLAAHRAYRAAPYASPVEAQDAADREEASERIRFGDQYKPEGYTASAEASRRQEREEKGYA